MPEYTYLLENRLTLPQQHAFKQVREAAREAGMTIFLAGGAVRDLTTGSSVRNFDFVVQGNALALEQALAARGGELWGTHEPTRTLSFWFPGSVRVQVASARSEEYPKPGKPVYHFGTIVDDLRRRDFTANAMALSLNEGSYGLLLDPLNGVADIEARLLRLASNYGFIEDPSRLVRAVRLTTRLGWQMDEKTATRYANAKESEAIKALSSHLRGYELEKIASEEDALVILKALESEGWMEHLMAAWTSAKADTMGIESLRRNWIQLLMQGVTADLAAAHLELLTAKMVPAEIAALKKCIVHPGLLRQWETLDDRAKEFGRALTGKAAAAPSATWKLLTTEPAEPILWLAHTRKPGAVDTKFKNFFTVWPEFKKKVPAPLMLEMRITPELPGYAELLEQLFYQLIDGNLETDEQMRAFLEPYSPPAPPPPPTIRRSRAKKSESKSKRRTVAPDDEDDEDEDRDPDDEDEDEIADADADAPGTSVDALDDVADEEEDDLEVKALASTLGKGLLRTDNAIDDEAADEDDAEEPPISDVLTDEDADVGEPEPAPPAKPVAVSAAGGQALAAPTKKASPKPAASATAKQAEPAPGLAPAAAAKGAAVPPPAAPVSLAAKQQISEKSALAAKASPAKPAPTKAAPAGPVASKPSPQKATPAKAVAAKAVPAKKAVAAAPTKKSAPPHAPAKNAAVPAAKGKQPAPAAPGKKR